MPLDFQTQAAIAFLILLSAFLYWRRKKLHTQKILFPLLYFSMYKTKFGISFMDKFSKTFNKSLKYLGYAGIVIGFLGMAFLSFSLIHNLFVLFTRPEAAPGVGLVLPFRVRGAFFVPFFYWIISIFIIALVHEFSHGIVARVHNLKIKSSGFAFLGILVPIIPAAFVELDEKELKKRPYKQQLSVFAAGPFSNIILAFVVLAISAFIFSPIVESMVEFSGVEITGFIDGDYPAKDAGIQEGEVVKEIDDVKIVTLDDFSNLLKNKSPGTSIELKTNRSEYNIILAKNPENDSASYLGVYVQQGARVKESFEQTYGAFIPAAILWTFGLFRWLIILNLGIGLFNLVPIGPIDGGRMLQLGLRTMFSKETGDKLWRHISIIFLVLVLVNIGVAFIR